MRKLSTLFYGCALLLFLSGCSEGGSTTGGNCSNQSQVIDESSYNSVNTTNYTITSVTLNQDCLDVTISSSGCDINNWQMNLYSSNNFPDITPLQRNLKVELVNGEACLTVLTKTVSFDLIPIQIAGQDEMILNLQGWSQPITYHY